MDAFIALADGNRRRIIETLAQRELSVNDLAAAFAVSQPAISQHLKVLREAGLVRVRPEAQRRLYSVAPEGLREVESWLDRTRRQMASQLDALERHLDSTTEERQ